MSGIETIGAIVALMALLAAVEAAVPLRQRSAWTRAHLAPNLALTAITFATNLVFSAAMILTLASLEARGLGLLNQVSVPGWAGTAAVVVVLDLAFYVAHVSMHRVPALWRYHRVHHSDPFVDVTTTIRQHPGEGAIRYAFMAAFALPLGAGVGGFALYRTLAALSGLFEHANIRVAPALDRLLALVTTWPNMHKVHHSRHVAQTNSNYSNIFSIWDRLFGTYTPSSQGTDVAYGLDGFDDLATQSTAGLLAVPFRERKVRAMA